MSTATQKLGYLKIDLPDFDQDYLYACSMTHSELMHNDKIDDSQISEKRLNRLSVNLLRHKYSNYNEIISKFERRPKLKLKIFTLVVSEIAAKYPFLKPECDEQINSKKTNYKNYLKKFGTK